jgi:hypothetical protein
MNEENIEEVNTALTQAVDICRDGAFINHHLHGSDRLELAAKQIERLLIKTDDRGNEP